MSKLNKLINNSFDKILVNYVPNIDIVNDDGKIGPTFEDQKIEDLKHKYDELDRIEREKERKKKEEERKKRQLFGFEQEYHNLKFYDFVDFMFDVSTLKEKIYYKDERDKELILYYRKMYNIYHPFVEFIKLEDPNEIKRY